VRRDLVEGALLIKTQVYLFIYHLGCHEYLLKRGMQDLDHMIRIRVLPPASDKSVPPLE
jgi:hypothetical protein